MGRLRGQTHATQDCSTDDGLVLTRTVNGETAKDGTVSEIEFTQTQTVLVPCLGGMLPVRPGVLDNAARLAFGGGQCHAFALALAEATGWTLAFYGRATCAEDWRCDGWHPCSCQVDHLGCLDSAGRFVDIEGAVPATSLVRGWIHIGPINAQRVAALAARPDWPVPATEVARTMVDPLLASIGRATASGTCRDGQVLDPSD